MQIHLELITAIALLVHVYKLNNIHPRLFAEAVQYFAAASDFYVICFSAVSSSLVRDTYGIVLQGTIAGLSMYVAIKLDFRP